LALFQEFDYFAADDDALRVLHMQEVDKLAELLSDPNRANRGGTAGRLPV
jgi:hypothetical protein